MNTESLNTQATQTVSEGDVPQITRNIINKDTTRDYEALKKKINNFLWEELPMKTTILRAEILACKIFRLIIDEMETPQ